MGEEIIEITSEQTIKLTREVPIRNFFSRMRGFVSQNISWLAQISGISIAAVTIFIVEYSQQVAVKEEEEQEAFATARACGAVIKKILFPAVMLPVLRWTFTVLQNSNLGRLLGLDRRFDSHKAAAAGLLTFASVHTIAHLYRDPAVILTQEGITGFSMILSIIGPLGGAYFIRKIKAARRQPYYLLFLRPHQIGAAAFITCYACHTEDFRLAFWVAGIGGAFCLDRLIEELFFTQPTVTTYVQLHGDNLVELGVAKTPHFAPHTPGQYAYLSLPGLLDGMLSYGHPFTIANSHDDLYELRFLIGPNGRWSRGLIHLVQDGKFPPATRVTISGPFGSPLQSQAKKSDLMLVSTGTGLSPFTALLHYHAKTRAPVKVIVIHITREVEEFAPLLDAIKYAAERGVRAKEAHFYLTCNKQQLETSIEKLSQRAKELKMQFVDVDQVLHSKKGKKTLPNRTSSNETCSTKAIATKEYELTTSGFFHRDDLQPHPQPILYCHKGRFDPCTENTFRPADLSREIKMITNRRAVTKFKGTVFFCGNPKAGEDLKALCRQHNVNYTKEAFSF